MSLSKQLLLLISVLFLMIFSVNYVLSVNNIRSYLEGEAEVHAQDTATSLGLSLSPYMEDETDPIIETTMKAIFDRGYYQEVKLVNIDGVVLVKLSNNNVFEGIPEWFVERVPMKVAAAESEISSGWNMRGVVHVVINSGYAYHKLFEQVKTSFYYSLATFIISIILLFSTLRMTLSSLRKIDGMALTIASGEFQTIEPLPWTTEVRNVAQSMNMMSGKLEWVIQRLNAKLLGIGKKLQQDELTGLLKKASFDTDMKQLFSADNNAYIFIIKIDGLSELVKELDNHSIDLFLKDFSRVLTAASQDDTAGNISAYRFFGSEFALMIKKMELSAVESFAKKLSTAFLEVGEKYQKPDIAHIGIVPFNLVDTSEGMLLAGNEAYEKAQIIGKNGYYIRSNENQAKDMAEWKSLVFNVVANESYIVDFINPIWCCKDGQVVMEEAFLKVVDDNKEAVAIGTFVSIAEKFSKVVDIDKGVTLKVINHIKSQGFSHAIAINLSTRTIKNSSFRSWLSELMRENAALSQQLVFSFSAYAVAKEVSVYEEFVDFIHQLNAKVMIKRFETRSLSPKETKQLKPDYIRLSREIGEGASTSKEKAAFIETMKDLSALLGIDLLMENITQEADRERVRKIGVTGISQ